MYKKLFMAFCAILAVCGLQSCSDDDNIDPNEAFKSALSSLNLNLQNVKWEKDGVYTKAEGQQGLYDVDVWFTPEAKWAMTQTDYGRDQINLPSAITAALTTGEYAQYQVDDIDFYQRADISFFVIEVESPGKVDTYLYYTADGNLFKTSTIDEKITPATQFQVQP